MRPLPTSCPQLPSCYSRDATHKARSAALAQVLSLSDTPLMHGETPLWPFWAPLLAVPYQQLARLWSGSGRYWVIPEDVSHKTLMRNDSLWCERSSPREQWSPPPPPPHSSPARAAIAAVETRRRRSPGEWEWCGGPPLSYFHAEYFHESELFPSVPLCMHGLLLQRPLMPWRLLWRAYGSQCDHVARFNPYPQRWGSVHLDLKHPNNTRFKRPATRLHKMAEKLNCPTK